MSESADALDTTDRVLATGLPRMNSPKRLLMVVNVGWFFLSHRLPIALAAKRAGFDVHIACGTDSAGEEESIRAHGMTFHRLAINRAGRTLPAEVRLLWQLRSLYRRLAPDVIHHVTIKPVLYGGVICRVFYRGAVIQSISGLGYVFTKPGMVGAVFRWGVAALYRVALSGTKTKTIFQNNDDLSEFVRRGLVAAKRAILIRGSGVDLEEFKPRSAPPGPPTVLLPARMLRDKGVVEFIAAAALLRRQGVRAEFMLAGAIDTDNPAAIARDELLQTAGQAGVSWLGHRTDMPSLLSAAHIVCLPSYREGLPKVLLEAAASARAMVAADVPGCREIVIPGVTGLLVPPRDVERLAAALAQLISDPGLRNRMGNAARKLCEEEFGVETVVNKTLELYRA